MTLFVCIMILAIFIVFAGAINPKPLEEVIDIIMGMYLIPLLLASLVIALITVIIEILVKPLKLLKVLNTK